MCTGVHKIVILGIDIAQAYCDYAGFGIEEPLGLVVPEAIRRKVSLDWDRDEVLTRILELLAHRELALERRPEGR